MRRDISLPDLLGLCDKDGKTLPSLPPLKLGAVFYRRVAGKVMQVTVKKLNPLTIGT